MRIGALLLFALLAANASGTTVTLLRDGVPVVQGEVCRFPAGDPENPFKRWLTSQDVTCVAAGLPLPIPDGSWNVFGKSSNALSTAPVLVDGAAAPATLSLSLDPAAIVAPLLKPGHRGVVYAPRRGSAFPVDERVTVPSGEELWLFVLEKSVPVAVVPIAALEPGSERTVDARSGGPSAVIGWLQVSEADRAAIRDARLVPAPVIRATTGGPALNSDPLPPLTMLNGAFVRVRGVSAGEAELELGGRGWIPHRRRVKVASAITVAPAPLVARAAGSIAVNWSTADDLPALNRSIRTCETSEKAAQFEVSVSACAPPSRPNEPIDASTCSLVRKETFEPQMTYGLMPVEDVVPGVYRAELRFGKLPPISGTVTVPPLQLRSLRLQASYVQAYGGLTHGGEPLGEDAVIEFPGDGIGFATRETGEYRAVLRMLLGPEAQINVSACDGAPRALVLTDRPMRRNARFDIDIPANELVITVTDTFTRMPLAGATVRYVVMSAALPRRPVFTRTVTTGDEGDAEGIVVIKSLPERELRIAVSHPGYQKQDIDPFSITRSETRKLDVQLMPLRGSRGKIVSPKLFESGAVFWFSASGSETERAELASDGTFVYSGSHGPDETMTVVSLSHPVWTLRTPPLERRQTIELRFPDAPVREFDVSAEGSDWRDARYIGVVIGGVRVPQPALRQHQFLRNLSATIRGAGPLRVRDVAETGPIDVVLGPTVDEVSSRLGGMDLFALPQFADAPRKRLPPGATAIAFELK